MNEAGYDEYVESFFQGPMKSDKKLLGRPEPWPEPVELKDILAELLVCNQRHIYQKEEYMFVDAMIVVLTYTFQHFEFCPILYITSPVPGCGKTTNLDWFKKYVC